uniref:Uncharacterized protein n=1 Tax=Quercus lobata TaxID=97700 RepID=A0A7N2RE08_QUELO
MTKFNQPSATRSAARAVEDDDQIQLTIGNEIGGKSCGGRRAKNGDCGGRRVKIGDHPWASRASDRRALIGVDWRSKTAAWTEDRRRQRGGLEIGGDGVVVRSGSDGGFSLFLSFRSFLSLTLILSLRLDVGFGFGLNFCYGFMMVAVEGCCGGDGDGFTVGLRSWLRIWVRFVLCCSGSVGLWVLQWIVKLFEEPEHLLRMLKERDESLHEISTTGESSQWGQDDSSTNEAMDYFEAFSTSFQGNVYIGKRHAKGSEYREAEALTVDCPVMSKMPAPPEAKFIPSMLWFVRPVELFTRERKGGGTFLVTYYPG